MRTGLQTMPASGQGHHHYGAPIFIVLGVFLILVGAGLIWMGTAGKEWSNTHNRLLQPVPHYSRRQSAYNIWAGRIGGLAAMVLGVIVVIVR